MLLSSSQCNYFTCKVFKLERIKPKVSPSPPMYSLGEKGSGDEGRAAVGSVHAGMMRPLTLEALVVQKRVHQSGHVLQAAARPSPPTPSPL